jgi:hypothetical protein
LDVVKRKKLADKTLGVFTKINGKYQFIKKQVGQKPAGNIIFYASV